MVLLRLLELPAGLFLFTAMYWSPTLVAYGRRADHLFAIVVVNSLLGWTLLGWIIALVWSIAAKPSVPATACSHLRNRLTATVVPLAPDQPVVFRPLVALSPS